MVIHELAFSFVYGDMTKVQLRQLIEFSIGFYSTSWFI